MYWHKIHNFFPNDSLVWSKLLGLIFLLVKSLLYRLLHCVQEKLYGNIHRLFLVSISRMLVLIVL